MRHPVTRPGAVLVLAALALALLPAGALARSHHRFSVHRYRVLYEGSGSYDVRLSDEGGVAAHEHADFHWKAAYTPLVVLSRPGPVGMATRRAGSSGGGEWSISLVNVEESCAKNGGLKLAPLGIGSGMLGHDGSLSLRLIPGREEAARRAGYP